MEHNRHQPHARPRPGERAHRDVAGRAGRSSARDGGRRRQTELDLLDLNNSFPGDRNGTHTQRLARLLAEKVLDGSDVVLDVHGGGSWNINCFIVPLPRKPRTGGLDPDAADL